MKHLRLWVTLGILGLLAAVGSVALPHALGGSDQRFGGGSYIITLRDLEGNFAARQVITLHADQTMSVVDSGQDGPTYFYSSELGAWKPAGNGRIVARTIDFDYPPNPDVARLDYTISFMPDRSHLTGTIIISTFPLENGNPLVGDGTVILNYTFAGELIKP
jgi:hypothetical protein